MSDGGVRTGRVLLLAAVMSVGLSARSRAQQPPSGNSAGTQTSTDEKKQAGKGNKDKQDEKQKSPQNKTGKQSKNGQSKKSKSNKKNKKGSTSIQYRPTELKAFRLGSVGSISQFVENRWSDLAVEIENATDQDVMLLATSNLQGQATQYGRRFWVPANARRVTSYPVFFNQAPKKNRYQIDSRLIPADGGAVVKSQEAMLHTTRVPAGDLRSVSAILLEPFVDIPDRELKGYSEEPAANISVVALKAMRKAMGFGPRISIVADDPWPATAASLSSVDNLTITGNRILEYPATLQAVRQWLLEGGRLWIMLDRVDMSVVNSLVGESLNCHVIDTAELTKFRMESPETNEAGELRSYDYPVKHVRVLLEGDDVEVIYEVNGWPASFILNVGRGQVVFTTIEPRGWMGEGISVVTNDVEFDASPELGEIGQMLLAPRAEAMIDPTSLKGYLNQQIGYRIVSRTAVVLVLAVFFMGLILAGWLMRRAGRLEWIMAVGPALAVITSTVLLVLGFSSKQAVPPTLAMEQWVEVEPKSETLRIEGLLGIYNQEVSEAQVGTTNGRFELDLRGMEGETRRLVYTDYNRWRWENLTINGGTVRYAPFVSFVQLDEPVEAVARLSAEGLEGELKLGPFREPADAILATPVNGNLALALDGMKFQAGVNDLMASDQLVSASLLNDEQRRRQEMLKSLLQSKDGPRYPHRPTILLWTKPVTDPFVFPDQSDNVVGESLISLPLRLRRSRPGKVTIPGALIPFRSVMGPGRAGANSIYNHRTGEWTPNLKTASRVWLRFQVPRQVLPLKVTKATLNMVLQAPDRNIVITAIRKGESVDIDEKLYPSGRVEFDVKASQLDVVQPGPDGSIVLGFEMSTSRKPGSVGGWTVEQLQLEIVGDVEADAGIADKDTPE